MKRHIAAVVLGALASVALAGGLEAHPETFAEGYCHKHAPNGETFLWSLVGFDGEIYVYDWSEIAQSTPKNTPAHCFDRVAANKLQAEEEAERRSEERRQLAHDIADEIVTPCLEHKLERMVLSEHDSLSEAISSIRTALDEHYGDQLEDIESAVNEVLPDQRHLVFLVYLEDCKGTALDIR
ncbi:MAG: hypothetical protein OXP66_16990 [Candidatus Tectomicrobia bacterium]|nr:hypothetical protein [Candidatus Tectomicrobia bacterium]